MLKSPKSDEGWGPLVAVVEALVNAAKSVDDDAVVVVVEPSKFPKSLELEVGCVAFCVCDCVCCACPNGAQSSLGVSLVGDPRRSTSPPPDEDGGGCEGAPRGAKSMSSLLLLLVAVDVDDVVVDVVDDGNAFHVSCFPGLSSGTFSRPRDELPT